MKALGAAAAVTVAGAMLAGCAGGPGGGGGKISGGKVVLAVLNDQSGIYSQLSGQGSVKAVQLAVADYKAKYGAKAVAKKIDVVSADHQNKPDIANSKAQELYDRRQADVILDVPTSSAALAVANVAKARKKVFFDVSAATTALEGAQCNKYTFHYGYNSYMLANGTGSTVTHDGARNWYIVYPDYAFGQDMNKSFTAAVRGAGGTVVKSDPAPFPNDNFSSFLLKAPTLNPKPQVLGAMQAGGDLVNLVKQYNEYKLRDKGIGLAVGLMFLTDIHSLGPDALAGTKFTDPWYWNADATNRAWADRFQAAAGKRPTFANAANYSAALQYLEALQRAGTDRSDAVVARLEGAKVDDAFARGGTIRAADHLLTHDVSLAQVKPGKDVTEPWDYEKVLSTVPAAQAFQPASPTCRLG
ncbi:ABC transporter substrate-binding protein [Actinoallomurus purpureus]|uniref:ABC transporter substrate-binding protein n=1 Tax=Actinoallomurus purpureus TaxID=478114 RepID=UPI002093BB35|nr:ABC transporter substrate-binding protein [Actinoallomurus purpureus]MCO6003935.1 ABC transporter substrate-binding protein [Actinoallomurus purpureus]